MLESASGVGLLFGPFMGAILYSYGGYMMPFFFTAALYFSIYPLIAYSLVRVNEIEAEASPRKKSPTKRSEEEQEISTWDLIKIRRFYFGIASQATVYTAVTFM
jgi:MFS family permease